MIDTDEIRDNIHIYEPLVHGTLRALCDEIDQLRGEQQTPPQVQGKTVDVRVQVVVHPDGRWWAGSDFAAEKRISINNGEAQYWLTATLPVPAEVAVVAKVHTTTNNETANSGGRG